VLLTDEIRAALGSHGLWKGRLRAAVDKGSSALTVAAVETDQGCDLGKFLYTVVDPAEQTAHWRKCRDIHAKFHREAARVLQLALAGKKAAAEEAMLPESEFARMSRALTAEMLKWRGQQANSVSLGVGQQAAGK
jgi:hypothetical protein